jgi:hypothetical protein
MLSSDQPGEVVAATAAITRILQAGGFDWHDFTAWTGEPAPAAAQTPKALVAEISAEELLPMVEAIRLSGCYLSPASKGFLDSLEDKAAAYGSVRFTEKQNTWLTNLRTSAIAAKQRREEIL